jgi:hypothetical protein
VEGVAALRKGVGALRKVAAPGKWLRLHLAETAGIRIRPTLLQIAATLRERRPAPGKRPAGRRRLVRISHAAVS